MPVTVTLDPKKHALAAARGLGRVVAWAANPVVTALVVFALLQHPGCGPAPGPGPTPPPGPGPVPPPPPPPVVKGSWLIGVTDNTARTPDLATILRDDALAQWLAQQGVSWRVLDKDSAAYHDYGYDRVVAASGQKPPCMILVAPDGASKVGASPATSDAVRAFVQGHPPTGPPELPFVQDGEEKRYLALLPSTKRRLALPAGGSWGDSNSVIPQDQWKEIDRRALFPAQDWIYDQDSIGSCVGNGSTGALRRCRVLAGMKDVRLAPGCTYAQINGGSDQGAVISDSLTALQKTGTITSKTLGSDERPFYLRQLPPGWQQEAARFRIEEAYQTDKFEEVMSGIQLGYVAVFGIMVGGNWTHFDQYGVCGHDRGPGNHCVAADGAKKLPDGRWVLDMFNSWGADWGPFKNGRAYIDAKHFQNGDQPDAYLVKACTEDPQEPNKPPRPKADPFSTLNAAPPAGVKAKGCGCANCACTPLDSCGQEGCPSLKGNYRDKAYPHGRDGWRWNAAEGYWFKPAPQPQLSPRFAPQSFYAMPASGGACST